MSNPRGECHQTGDTFRAALATVAFAFLATAGFAAEPTKSCCQPKAATVGKSCCDTAQADVKAAPCCVAKKADAQAAPCCTAKKADTKAAPCCDAGKTNAKASAAPCCAADKPADPHANHAGHTDPHASHAEHSAALELPPSDYSRESLYQLETTFTDDAGRKFALGTLKGRPVVLTMFFTSCSYACPLLVADMTRIRDALPPEQREQAALVLVTFDTVRDTPATLREYRKSRDLDGQWVLLHGDDDAVRELAALLGVKFKQETSGQFAHSNLISILNPEGEIVHQRAGLKGGLDEAGRALAQASR